jgi:L-rhamnose-H+ transport protein
MRTSHIPVALAILLFSGTLNGSAAVPLKFAKKSEWENLWLIQSILAMLVLPWVLVAFTIPRSTEVYRAAGLAPSVAAVGFGFGWGIGTLFYIIGVVLVGMSVSFVIILSLTATLGSLLPLLVLHPHEIYSHRGHLLLVSIAFTVIGVVLCADAGSRRVDQSTSAQVTSGNPYFWRGVFVCVLSGIFSPMLNFAFVFGDRLTSVAREFGASSFWAPNALWALTFTGAFVLNACYCLHHLGLQKSWLRFLEAPGENLLGGSVMGILLLASILTYGVGAEMLGTWGASAGWAINMCTTIFAANVWGVATGEWHGAPRRSRIELGLGLAATTVAIALASPAS